MEDSGDDLPLKSSLFLDMSSRQNGVTLVGLILNEYWFMAAGANK